MARVFLDVNKLIDVLENRDPGVSEGLLGHEVFISPLSVHILCYLYKRKMPDSVLSDRVVKFLLVDFGEKILMRGMEGPVEDFEDNVQLHSGAEAGCDIFLTNDKKLLEMKFFGKMKMVDHL